MIVELVTFKAPASADWQGILADARTTIPRWRSSADLIRKHYLVTDDGQSCGPVYLAFARRRRESARRGVASRIECRTGLTPQISYFNLMMLLDNAAGTVTEWSTPGEKGVTASA